MGLAAVTEAPGEGGAGSRRDGQLVREPWRGTQLIRQRYWCRTFSKRPAARGLLGKSVKHCPMIRILSSSPAMRKGGREEKTKGTCSGNQKPSLTDGIVFGSGWKVLLEPLEFFGSQPPGPVCQHPFLLPRARRFSH